MDTGYNTTCVSGCGSAWLERHLREVEVASSNPATPTIEGLQHFMRVLKFFFLYMQRIKKEVLHEGIYYL